MSVAVGNYEFEGPFIGAAQLENRPGVYAVVNCIGDDVTVLEVSDDHRLKSRLEQHPRLAAWQRYFPNSLGVLVHYTNPNSELERKTIMKNIHDEFGPFLNIASANENPICV